MPDREIANRDASDQEHAHPNRTRRVLLTGGALSLAAVAGSTFSRMQSASAQASSQPVVELLPSNDKSGATDVTNLTDAFNALPFEPDSDTGLTYRVGQVLLAPGDFYINAQVTKPPKVDLIGSGPGTVLHVVGSNINGQSPNFAGIYSHHPATSGPDQHYTKSGTIANLVVDGSGATAAGAIGIDIGDGWGHRIEHVWISNFTTSGAIGLSVCNRQFWTEKFSARHVNLINNTTAVQHWTAVSATSHEYQSVEYFIWAENNQNGLTFAGVLWNGHLVLNGNIGVITGTGPNWMVGFNNSSTVTAAGCINYEVNLMGGVNTDAGPDSVYFGDTSSTFTFQGLFRDAGGGGMVHTGSTNATPGQLQIRGTVIEGNTSLQAVTAPAPFPGSGTQTTNTQNDCVVYITANGGSITGIKVGATSGSVATTGLTASSGQTVQVYLPANYIISVTYTGSPSWTWISAL